MQLDYSTGPGGAYHTWRNREGMQLGKKKFQVNLRVRATHSVWGAEAHTDWLSGSVFFLIFLLRRSERYMFAAVLVQLFVLDKQS